MQITAAFPRHRREWFAPFWPAALLVCSALIVFWVKLGTDDGLVWIMQAEGSMALLNSRLGEMIVPMTSWLVFGCLVASSHHTFIRDNTSAEALFMICLTFGALLAILLHLVMYGVGRFPLKSIEDSARIERAIATASQNDPIANALRRHIENPTHAGLADGAKLLERSIRGSEMQRAMAAAKIIGIHDLEALEPAKMRGWMTPRDFKILQDQAVNLLANESQGKSMAWQAAALALVDRHALANPIAIHSQGRAQ